MNVRSIIPYAARLYHSLYFPPTVIFVAVMVATVFTWHSARVSLAQDVQTAANARITATESSITSTLGSYEEIVRGGVGLFQGSDQVTRADWANYIDAFSAKKKYSGVQGFGFAQVFSADDVPSVADFMATQGVDNFHITPAKPPRDSYAAVVYVQNVAATNSPTFGFDLYADPVRRAALLKARDTGNTAITGRLTLSDMPSPAPPVGFSLYAPYYGTESPSDLAGRQANIRGYVFATFRTGILFKTIPLSANNKTSGFRITVAGDKPGVALYESPNFAIINKRAHTIRDTRPLDLFGQTWNIEYVFDRGGLVSDIELRRPPSVLFGGVFIALLIASVVFLLLRSRAHELAAQKEHAVELAKDELLSLASHQLRTPATGVKQYVGMVLQGFAGRVPAEQRGLLEKAYASNDRQLQVINEILHLAKIDAGRIVLARQRTDLSELVTDIVNEQRPDLDSAGHHLRLQLPKRRLLANVDAHMLRMAIENLLSNAIKYTPPGGSIAVTVYRNRSRAHIQVSDTGIGIAQGDIEKLFKQFTRLPNEMSQQVGGTGIGLYLAKHLVELHGGHIAVHSTPGRGSVFTIEVPLKYGEL